MSEHTTRVMQKYTISNDHAHMLQADLNQASDLLNDITSMAFFRRGADKKGAIRALEEIEVKARKARNLLDPHLWPF